MIPIENPHLSYFAERHYQAIESYILKGTTKHTIESLDETIQKYIPEENFKSFIIAPPQKLAKFAEKIGELDQENEDFKYFLSLYIYLNNKTALKIKGKNGEEIPYNSRRIILDLEVFVCPYTNHDFIYNEAGAKSAELDHFFPKETYPYLALSFFNLVPCSKSSALLRKHKLLGVNPYESHFNFNQVQFKLKVKEANIAASENALEIELSTEDLPSAEKKRFEVNKEIFQIETQYQLHKPLVREKIQQILTYSESYIDELNQHYGGNLFENKEDILQQSGVLGNSNKNYHLHPFAKMEKDITEQLEI